MRIPPSYPRSKVFLSVLAALGSLAALGTAMAADINGVTINSAHADDSLVNGDVIPGAADVFGTGNAVIIPGGHSAPSASGNTVEVNWDNTLDYDIVGGGSFSGGSDVTNNTVRITETSGALIIDGLVVGGAGQDVNITGNVVWVNSGQVGTAIANGGVNGGLGNSSGDPFISVSGNEVHLVGSDVTIYGDSYGGWLQSESLNSGNVNGTVTGNEIYVDGATINGGVYGGGVHDHGVVTGNIVSVKNATIATNTTPALEGNVVGGRVIANTANKINQASHNTVTVEDSDAVNVYGGEVDGVGGDIIGNADDNTVTLISNSGGTISGNVIGGRFDHTAGSTASRNTVVIDGNYQIGGGVYGGSITGSSNSGNGNAIQNNVTLNDDAVVGDGVHGARISNNGNAAQNAVTLNGAAVIGGDVYGASIGGNGDATLNTVTVNDAADIGGDVHGAFISGDGDAANNTVTLNGAADITGSVYGAFIGDGTATQNTVTVNTGAVIGGDVYGASIDNGTATQNTVTLTGDAVIGGDVYGASIDSGGDATLNTVTVNSDADISGDVYGAFILGSGDATNNTVTLDGAANVGGDVYGAVVNGGTGTATHNTVNIGADVTLAASTRLYGGSASGDSRTGNTLNLNGWSGQVDSVNDFETYNIQVPDTLAPGTAIVTVAASTNLEGSTINLITSGGAPLADGSTVVSFAETTSGAITLGSGLANGGAGQGQYGVSLLYGTLTELVSGKLVTTVNGTRVHPQTKALSEGFLGGVAFVNQGADLVAGDGVSSLLKQTVGQNNVVGFAALSYGNARYETGSHVDVKGYSLLAGAGAGGDFAAGRLNVGAFLEAGDGDYDSHNSFTGYANVKGDGEAEYYGGGVLGRFDFKSGLYTEASLRLGHLKTDFKTNIVDVSGTRAKYDTRSNYVSTHLALGYNWALGKATRADVYGKYLWTHQSGDSVSLSTGDPVKFDAVNSQRLRLGGKVTWSASSQVDIFAGAAWEHEFDGDAKAKVYGRSISAPSLEGDSGIGELGVVIRPSINSPLSIAAGVQGYGGDRRGVTGSLQLKYGF
ncbi:MAG: hypothetical protein LBT71_11045 [Azoarcus sp.]|jgi:hypothetical protein|nr:hypothetical protein [Azoarcus sp.]